MNTDVFPRISTGQHTLEDRGNSSQIISDGPVKADYKEKQQYLGSGYYFWDENMKQAKIWGKKYKRYLIFETEMKFDDQVRLLNLVSDRRHMKWLLKKKDQVQRLFPKFFVDGNYTLGYLIEVLRTVSRFGENDHYFPFHACLAVDHSSIKRNQEGESFKFVERKTPGYTHLSPILIVCYYDVSSVSLRQIYPAR